MWIGLILVFSPCKRFDILPCAAQGISTRLIWGQPNCQRLRITRGCSVQNQEHKMGINFALSILILILHQAPTCCDSTPLSSATTNWSADQLELLQFQPLGTHPSWPSKIQNFIMCRIPRFEIWNQLFLLISFFVIARCSVGAISVFFLLLNDLWHFSGISCLGPTTTIIIPLEN